MSKLKFLTVFVIVYNIYGHSVGSTALSHANEMSREMHQLVDHRDADFGDTFYMIFRKSVNRMLLQAYCMIREIIFNTGNFTSPLLPDKNYEQNNYEKAQLLMEDFIFVFDKILGELVELNLVPDDNDVRQFFMDLVTQIGDGNKKMLEDNMDQIIRDIHFLSQMLSDSNIAYYVWHIQDFMMKFGIDLDQMYDLEFIVRGINQLKHRIWLIFDQAVENMMQAIRRREAVDFEMMIQEVLLPPSMLMSELVKTGFISPSNEIPIKIKGMLKNSRVEHPLEETMNLFKIFQQMFDHLNREYMKIIQVITRLAFRDMQMDDIFENISDFLNSQVMQDIMFQIQEFVIKSIQMALSGNNMNTWY